MNVLFGIVQLTDRWTMLKYLENGKTICLFTYQNKSRTLRIFTDEFVAQELIIPNIELGMGLGLDNAYSARGSVYFFYIS
jgi:hypothetical protein